MAVFLFFTIRSPITEICIGVFSYLLWHCLCTQFRLDSVSFAFFTCLGVDTEAILSCLLSVDILDDMLAGVGWTMQDYLKYGENDYYPPLPNGHRLFVHDIRRVAVRCGVAMGEEGDIVVSSLSPFFFIVIVICF